MNDFLKHFFSDHHEKTDARDDNFDSQDTSNIHDKADSDPEPIQADLTPFTAIKVDIYAFSIKIHLGSKFRVVILGKGNDKVKVRVDDSRLTIYEPKSHRNKYYHYQSSKAPLIDVTMPTGTQLERIKIKSFAGSTVLHNLTMQSLQIELLAGSAKLTEVTVSAHARVELSAGSLNIKHCNLNLNAELAAGSTKIEHSKLNGENRINLSAGSLYLTEDGQTKLSYQLSAALGSIVYHGEKRGRSFYHQATTKNNLYAETAVGSIKIN